MEMKQTHICITLIYMVAIFANCIEAEEKVSTSGSSAYCIRTCNFICRNRPDFNKCVTDCAEDRCLPPKLGSITSLSFYCNLGCSLHKCTDTIKDVNALLGCLDECLKVDCKA
ncbi:hypothetical protein ABFS82_09G101300 [Erythranthe guttata]